MNRRPRLSSRRNQKAAGFGYSFRMMFLDVVGLAGVVAGFHIFRLGHLPTYWPLEVYLVSLFFSLLALFVAGAYVENSDKLSIEYATVHLSSFLLVFPLMMTAVYAFTAYTERLKPARAVVIPAIFSFALLSLVVRRFSYQGMLRNRGPRYFSVLGRPDDLRSLWHELLEKNRKPNLTCRYHDVENKQTGVGGPGLASHGNLDTPEPSTCRSGAGGNRHGLPLETTAQGYA